jgi:hypothetical protein
LLPSPVCGASPVCVGQPPPGVYGGANGSRPPWARLRRPSSLATSHGDPHLTLMPTREDIPALDSHSNANVLELLARAGWSPPDMDTRPAVEHLKNVVVELSRAINDALKNPETLNGKDLCLSRAADQRVAEPFGTPGSPSATGSAGRVTDASELRVGKLLEFNCLSTPILTAQLGSMNWQGSRA